MKSFPATHVWTGFRMKTWNSAFELTHLRELSSGVGVAVGVGVVVNRLTAVEVAVGGLSTSTVIFRPHAVRSRLATKKMKNGFFIMDESLIDECRHARCLDELIIGYPTAANKSG